MAKTSCYKGRYHRTIGKHINSQGKLTPRKFLLGTDEAKAKRKVEQLERLWAEHAKQDKLDQQQAARLGIKYHGTYNRITGERKPGPVPDEPVWGDEALMVANAICKEQPSINVPSVPRGLGDGTHVGEPAAEYLERVTSLQKDYKCIAFIPDPNAFSEAQTQAAKHIDELGNEAEQLSKLASAEVTWAPGGMLHQALDDFINWLRNKYSRNGKLTANGEKLISATKRLKAASPDMPLERLRHDAIEGMARYWYQRPKAKRADGKETDKPISIETVKNMIKLMRRFLLWLNSTDRYAWQVAEHVIRSATNGQRFQDLLTEAEKKAAATGPESWTRKELIQLYQNATDRERLYMLLGLNAGFAQSEIEHLDSDELQLNADPPIVDYMRHKTGRRGGAKLWPETVAAIRWVQSEQATSSHGNGRAILKDNGSQMDAQSISNSWNRLLDRVQKTDPAFRRLPFKYLRKTAAQLMQDEGGGSSETIAIMEARAKWTGHDDQADRYYKRKMDGVYAANDRVCKYLAPMFDSAPDAFTKARKKGGGNITTDMVERIRNEYAACGNKSAVARKLGVSRQTVHRHLAQ